MAKARPELIGKTFGRWTVVSESDDIFIGRYKKQVVNVKCSCGTEKQLQFRLLKSGSSKSCGCYQKQVASEYMKNIWSKRNGS